jgi:methylated-DNA-protein-cysteine methyltransferase-like protein
MKKRSPSARTASDPDARRQRILATVDAIPRGSVATYGLVAHEAGLPRHARLVGKVLSTLAAGTKLPWWRVVSASGAIALRGDGGAVSEQRRRLAAEGVAFRPSGRIDLVRHLWRP